MQKQEEKRGIISMWPDPDDSSTKVFFAYFRKATMPVVTFEQNRDTSHTLLGMMVTGDSPQNEKANCK